MWTKKFNQIRSKRVRNFIYGDNTNFLSHSIPCFAISLQKIESLHSHTNTVLSVFITVIRSDVISIRVMSFFRALRRKIQFLSFDVNHHFVCCRTSYACFDFLLTWHPSIEKKTYFCSFPSLTLFLLPHLFVTNHFQFVCIHFVFVCSLFFSLFALDLTFHYTRLVGAVAFFCLVAILWIG